MPKLPNKKSTEFSEKITIMHIRQPFFEVDVEYLNRQKSYGQAKQRHCI
jgi:hypothetical protein